MTPLEHCRHTAADARHAAGDGTLLLWGISGSHAYGTAHPNSDTDWRGVFLAPTRDLLGLHPPADEIRHARIGDDPTPDLSLIEAGKFLRQAAKGNPNIVELVHLDTSHTPWLRVDEPDLAEQLLHAAAGLLSQRAVNSYLGFAHDQIRAVARAERGDASGRLHPRTREKHLLHCHRVLHQGLELATTGRVTVAVHDPEQLQHAARQPLEETRAHFERTAADIHARLYNGDTPLPPEPDTTAASQWLADARTKLLDRASYHRESETTPRSSAAAAS